MSDEYKILSNGVKIPIIGFGTYKLGSHEDSIEAVKEAIKIGYRHIDAAAFYNNEEAVGNAISKCGVAREELFITTKLWVQDASYEGAKQAIETSLDK